VFISRNYGKCLEYVSPFKFW